MTMRQDKQYKEKMYSRLYIILLIDRSFPCLTRRWSGTGPYTIVGVAKGNLCPLNAKPLARLNFD
jgi:hypothetical protein